jgi:hypothetical protein
VGHNTDNHRGLRALPLLLLGDPYLYCVPILSPLDIIKGQWALEAVQVVALRRAGELGNGLLPHDFSMDPSTQPPGSVLLPSLADLHAWRAELDFLEDRTLTVDIESAGHLLVMIGFCRVVDLKSICVPFRKRQGQLYWSDTDVVVAARWVAELLESPNYPKVFHNGQAFDVPMLEFMGFEVNGYVDDTMILQHVAYPEMPKGLEFVSILYAWARPWKYLSKLEKEGDGK